MPPLRLAINGAAGRMGRRLVALAAADPQLAVAAAIESPGHAKLGQDAGTLAGIAPLGVALSAGLGGRDAVAPVDVVIDFSVPTAAEAILDACFAQRLPLVLATTGLTAPQIDKLRAVAGQIPLLWSPNMSLAVNLTMKLCEVAAQALADKDADVEIIERHHRFKEDAPSGTALKFGEVISRNMGQTAQATAAVAGRGNALTGRSAITPSAWATTRASTPSSSACWARRSSLRSAPATAIAMPKGHWRPRSFSPASRLDFIR